MKSWLRWIVLTLVLAVIFHFLTVTLFPKAIMALAIKRCLSFAIAY